MRKARHLEAVGGWRYAAKPVAIRRVGLATRNPGDGAGRSSFATGESGLGGKDVAEGLPGSTLGAQAVTMRGRDRPCP